MENILLSAEMKMADLINSNSRLLRLIPRFGMKLGFGEESVKEVCFKADISPTLFLLICNISAFNNYLPMKSEIKQLNISQLINYLKASHSEYRMKYIPELEKSIVSVSGDKNCNSRNAYVISHFFDEYKEELMSHLSYEENIVFPYIANILHKKITKGYSIEKFEENHSNIDIKLSDFKNILLKYLPADCTSQSRYDALESLFILEKEVEIHNLIENKILVPHVSLLENLLSKR
jgi:regulator of cell morphogenesis and NO signaling